MLMVPPVINIYGCVGNDDGSADDAGEEDAEDASISIGKTDSLFLLIDIRISSRRALASGERSSSNN